MRSILRLASSSTLMMSSSPSQSNSQRLSNLIQQLRLYKAPSVPGDIDDDGPEVDARGKVFSSLALAESAAPTTAAAAAREPSQSFRPRRAAVLVCLFEGHAGDLRVILTKRSSNLSTHSGEVSLPGGKADEGDKDEKDTATREAKEEIGLDPSLVNVVTVLEPFLSKHLLRVVPVIGVLSDRQSFKPVLNSAEVEAIFDAPLEMFLKDVNRRSEEREWMGTKYLVHYFDFEAEDKKFLIWGLTASILVRAASVVYQRPPCFPEQNPNFTFPQQNNGKLVMR